MNQKKQDQTSEDFQTSNVVLLSFCHFIHDVYSSFLAPLLPFIIEKFGLTLAQAGLLSTVMQIPAFANPLLGKLADRLSVRYFIILAPAMTAVPMSILNLAPSYGVLLLLLFFAGVSVSLFHVPAPVMVYRVSGSRAGKGMSFFMTGGELARTLGPLAITAVVALLGFDGYSPVMIVGLLVSLLMFLQFRNLPVVHHGGKKVSIRNTFREMRPVLTPLSVILVVRGFMHASLTAFLPLYILQTTNDIWLAGSSLALFEGAGVVGIMTVGSLSDRLGRRNMLLFSLILAPVGLLSFAFGSGFIRIPALLLTGFTLLSTTPVMLAMIQEGSGKGSSSANGIFMMVSFLARSAVVVVVGAIGDQIGLEKTYILSALIGFLGIPVILKIPRDVKKSSSVHGVR